MKIYDSFGTFDAVNKEFKLAVQTTNIGTDIYEITAYYDISDTTRYAIVAILQTKDGNDTDLSNLPENCACLVSNVKFTDLIKSYLTSGDKNINNAVQGEVINVIVHHGIGFNPTTNLDDNLYIENYKAGTYTYYAKGCPPGRGGKGVIH